MYANQKIQAMFFSHKKPQLILILVTTKMIFKMNAHVFCFPAKKTVEYFDQCLIMNHC